MQGRKVSKKKLLLLLIPLWSFTFLAPDYFQHSIFGRRFAEGTFNSLLQGCTLLMLSYLAVLSLNSCGFYIASAIYALAICLFILAGAFKGRLLRAIGVSLIIIFVNVSLKVALLLSSIVSIFSVYPLPINKKI